MCLQNIIHTDSGNDIEMLLHPKIQVSIHCHPTLSALLLLDKLFHNI